MVFNIDTSANGGTPKQDTGSGVGLKGSFGNLFVGNVYSQVWQTMAAADASNWGSWNSGTPFYTTNGVDGGKSDSLVYTLPTLTQGLDIVIEQSFGGAQDNIGDSTGVGISYTSGPFFVKYAGSQLKTKSGVTEFNVLDGTGTATTGKYDGSTASYQALTLTYDLGMVKLYAGGQTMSINDDGKVAENKNTFGITIPLGSASISWGHGSADYTNSSNVKSSLSGDKILARYNLSKRTTVYAAFGKQTQSDSSASTTVSALGLFHSF